MCRPTITDHTSLGAHPLSIVNLLQLFMIIFAMIDKEAQGTFGEQPWIDAQWTCAVVLACQRGRSWLYFVFLRFPRPTYRKKYE